MGYWLSRANNAETERVVSFSKKYGQPEKISELPILKDVFANC